MTDDRFFLDTLYVFDGNRSKNVRCFVECLPLMYFNSFLFVKTSFRVVLTIPLVFLKKMLAIRISHKNGFFY